MRHICITWIHTVGNNLYSSFKSYSDRNRTHVQSMNSEPMFIPYLHMYSHEHVPFYMCFVFCYSAIVWSSPWFYHSLENISEHLWVLNVSNTSVQVLYHTHSQCLKTSTLDCAPEFSRVTVQVLSDKVYMCTEWKSVKHACVQAAWRHVQHWNRALVEEKILFCSCSLKWVGCTMLYTIIV